jgi:hypothetical protein
LSSTVKKLSNLKFNVISIRGPVIITKGRATGRGRFSGQVIPILVIRAFWREYYLADRQDRG